MESPMRTCWNATKGAVRSTSFLSAFVGIFQAVICLQRKVVTRDHKLIYWFAGCIAALSVLLEKKGRQSELSLYVLPRAADSFWYILVNQHLLPDIKNAEVLLFCLCMGGIMYYLEYEPDTMAPFLRGLIRRFLASRISTADPAPKLGAPYSYVNTLNSGHDLNSQDKHPKSPASSLESGEQLNLEAFSGL
ncbi:hypothetical protein KI387_011938 [Taxus chinensis]|uniref:Uncharacterized protein n=1 Tax=Taxus chinensis TaxID=29808 RepID=A0AA38FFN3_TAXCH|nr:hypothetical protein KI387_011938 [Taxus chinensis]